MDPHVRFEVCIELNGTAKFNNTDCRDRTKTRIVEPVAVEEKRQTFGVATKLVQCRWKEFGLAMNLMTGCRQGQEMLSWHMDFEEFGTAFGLVVRELNLEVAESIFPDSVAELSGKAEQRRLHLVGKRATLTVSTGYTNIMLAYINLLVPPARYFSSSVSPPESTGACIASVLSTRVVRLGLGKRGGVFKSRKSFGLVHQEKSEAW
jgi:hypothetical protein